MTQHEINLLLVIVGSLAPAIIPLAIFAGRLLLAVAIVFATLAAVYVLVGDDQI
jgi:uncharacterized membrane protein